MEKNMKITLSHEQWNKIGKTAGWNIPNYAFVWIGITQKTKANDAYINEMFRKYKTEGRESCYAELNGQPLDIDRFEALNAIDELAHAYSIPLNVIEDAIEKGRPDAEYLKKYLD